MIHDNKGYGLHWANKQISNLKNKLNGQYIYVLDDDDHLLCNNFIEELKALIVNLNGSPRGLIICKGFISNKEFPTVWKQGTPKRGQICASNMIVKNDIFNKHAMHWDESKAGDWFFFKSIWKNSLNAFWWNKVVFQAYPSSGLTEKQKKNTR
jgi:hypothetical protein